MPSNKKEIFGENNTMPYVKSFDGNKIYYEVKGDGMPLIFLPCVGAKLDYWKYQKPLAEKFKLVMVDTAGVRKSGKNGKEYTYPSLARDVIAVIEKERLENPIIVGHSFGGVIALEIGAMLKERIKGMICVDSLMPLTFYYASVATPEEMEVEMKNYDGDYQEYYDNLIYGMLTDRLDSEKKDWVLSVAGYEQLDPKVLRDMVRQMLLHDYHDIIPQVTCPIRYIIREKKTEYFEIVLREQKDAKIMKNVGHLMNIEDPETFNNYVDEIAKELIKEEN